MTYPNDDQSPNDERDNELSDDSIASTSASESSQNNDQTNYNDSSSNENSSTIDADDNGDKENVSPSDNSLNANSSSVNPDPLQDGGNSGDGDIGQEEKKDQSQDDNTTKKSFSFKAKNKAKNYIYKAIDFVKSSALMGKDFAVSSFYNIAYSTKSKINYILTNPFQSFGEGVQKSLDFPVDIFNVVRNKFNQLMGKPPKNKFRDIKDLDAKHGVKLGSATKNHKDMLSFEINPKCHIIDNSEISDFQNYKKGKLFYIEEKLKAISPLSYIEVTQLDDGYSIDIFLDKEQKEDILTKQFDVINKSILNSSVNNNNYTAFLKRLHAYSTSTNPFPNDKSSKSKNDFNIDEILNQIKDIPKKPTSTQISPPKIENSNEEISPVPDKTPKNSNETKNDLGP